MSNRYAWVGLAVAHPGHLIVDSWTFTAKPEPLLKLLANYVGVDEPTCHRVLELCKENLELCIPHLKEIKARTEREALAMATAAAAKSGQPVTPNKPPQPTPQMIAAAHAAAANAAIALLQSVNKPAPPTTHTSSFDGRWDTLALGRFAVRTMDSHVHAYRIRGTYALGGGMIRGILTRSSSATANAITAPAAHASAAKDWKENGWTLNGVWKTSEQRGWKPVRFDFDANFQVMRGSWSNANDGGSFTGQRVDNSPTTLTVKKGLWNLGNTCYMNSFLQAMYMTVGLRQELLRVPCTIDYGRADAAHQAKLRADGKETPRQPISAVLLPPGLHGPCLPNPTVTIQRLQRLYLQLLLTSRPSISPYDFQCGLPEPWRGPNQQDSGEFGLWMLEQLGTSEHFRACSAYCCADVLVC